MIENDEPVRMWPLWTFCPTFHWEG